MPFPNETEGHQHVTTETSLPLRGSCECGACSFEVHTAPKARFRCHCLICQAFNGKPFADVVAVRAKDVVLKNAGNISFKKYRPPPNFNRGVCRTCGKPIVEVAGFQALPSILKPGGGVTWMRNGTLGSSGGWGRPGGGTSQAFLMARSSRWRALCSSWSIRRVASLS